MSAYAIIPARGGSKGIPGKNLRRVDGVPLVARAVMAARAAPSVDRVFVSTDDDAIAEVGMSTGAEIIERPSHLAGDEASSESALLHFLDALRDRGEPDPDILVMIQCTSPFNAGADVEGTIAALTRERADCAFTGARSHAFLWRPDSDGAVAVNHDATTRLRRQDRPPEFVETGAVYAMRTAGFRAARHRFFGRVAICEVVAEHALEVDEVGDLGLAEALAWRARRSRALERLPTEVTALAFDFDGVLTDNQVLTLQDGTEGVLSDRSDGFGIEMLRKAGIQMVVLSKELNPVVTARCRKLALESVHGVDDKVSAFHSWMVERDLDPTTVVFVGNDVNDVECLYSAGCGVVVADAHPEAIAAADVVLTQSGGRGAVRELADLILSRAKGA